MTLTVTTMDFATGMTPMWVSLVTWALGLVYLIYHAVLSTDLHANARVRNEGYDVEGTAGVDLRARAHRDCGLSRAAGEPRARTVAPFEAEHVPRLRD